MKLGFIGIGQLGEDSCAVLPKSPKTGHASQCAGQIGPHGHSITGHTSARLLVRDIQKQLSRIHA